MKKLYRISRSQRLHEIEEKRNPPSPAFETKGSLLDKALSSVKLWNGVDPIKVMFKRNEHGMYEIDYVIAEMKRIGWTVEYSPEEQVSELEYTAVLTIS